MKRNINLSEISDGRLYGSNDMVKADCHGCKDCSDCCRGMGNSVILDPYDIYRLEAGLGKGLEALMEAGMVELNVVDGCILPNLKMSGQNESCAFLNVQGRCSIHKFRPGICRLFPLGRYYEKGDFKYLLQIHECSAKDRAKVKVNKWIDTPQLQKNHNFVCRWHYLLNDVEDAVRDCKNGELTKWVNMILLKKFFITLYDVEKDFYEQFDMRYKNFNETLKKLLNSAK